MKTSQIAGMKSSGVLEGIHGLRGACTIVIILFHTALCIKTLSFNADLLYFFGKIHHIVGLFFSISALGLLFATTPSLSKPGWTTDYFIRRFFRIAPLYYVVMIYIIGRGLYYGINPSIKDIVLNMTFTFGTAPFSGMVWAGWTLGVEAIFYVIFPALILTVSSFRIAATLMVISLVLSLTATEQLTSLKILSAGYDWSNQAFMPHFTYFFAGILAFFWAARIKTRAELNVVIAITLTLVSILTLSDPYGYMPHAGAMNHVLWSMLLAGLLTWQCVSPSRWLKSRLLAFLAERCLSLYLIHPIAIVLWDTSDSALLKFAARQEPISSYLISCAIVFTLTLLISEVTYRLIERPGVNFGRKLIERHKKASDKASMALPS